MEDFIGLDIWGFLEEIENSYFKGLFISFY